MKYLAVLCGLALGSCGAFAVYKTVHVARELNAYDDCLNTLGRWDSSAHRCIDVTEDR